MSYVCSRVGYVCSPAALYMTTPALMQDTASSDLVHQQEALLALCPDCLCFFCPERSVGGPTLRRPELPDVQMVGSRQGGAKA